MGSRYNHLSAEDRNGIQTGLNLGLSRRALAGRMGSLDYGSFDLTFTPATVRGLPVPGLSSAAHRGHRKPWSEHQWVET
jgi:hypothetical protein